MGTFCISTVFNVRLLTLLISLFPENDNWLKAPLDNFYHECESSNHHASHHSSCYVLNGTADCCLFLTTLPQNLTAVTIQEETTRDL